MTDDVLALAAELASLKRQYGDLKGSLIFLGHDPDDIDRLGGVPA